MSLGLGMGFVTRLTPLWFSSVCLVLYIFQCRALKRQILAGSSKIGGRKRWHYYHSEFT